MSYSQSDEYQKEIAEQYKKRTQVFSAEEVVSIAQKLGFSITKKEIVEAEAGNVHATYITDSYVLKITKDKEKGYLANKVVSEALLNEPVVQVLAHNVYDKTPYEVLIMKKSSGSMLQDTLLELSEEMVTVIFSQVLDVVNKCSQITSETFGFVYDTNRSSESFQEFQASRVEKYLQKIRKEKLADEPDLIHIESFFSKHSHILEDEVAVLVHTDLHMGNILHEGRELMAVIDWDSAQYAPLYATLRSIIGFIDDPSQFVEGTPDFDRFKGKNFKYLLPTLKEKLPEVFSDKDLLLKLTLLGLVEGLMWVSQNWSEAWNKEMIAGLVSKETPKDLSLLKDSYHGKVLS